MKKKFSFLILSLPILTSCVSKRSNIDRNNDNSTINAIVQEDIISTLNAQSEYIISLNCMSKLNETGKIFNETTIKIIASNLETGDKCKMTIWHPLKQFPNKEYTLKETRKGGANGNTEFAILYQSLESELKSSYIVFNLIPNLAEDLIAKLPKEPINTASEKDVVVATVDGFLGSYRAIDDKCIDKSKNLRVNFKFRDKIIFEKDSYKDENCEQFESKVYYEPQKYDYSFDKLSTKENPIVLLITKTRIDTVLIEKITKQNENLCFQVGDVRDSFFLPRNYKITSICFERIKE